MGFSLVRKGHHPKPASAQAQQAKNRNCFEAQGLNSLGSLQTAKPVEELPSKRVWIVM
jgi:hypothetical protein